MLPPSLVRSRIGNRLVHPGEILLGEFMRPFGISQNALARCLGVAPRCINQIVHGKRAITASTEARERKPFPIPNEWVATFDGEVIDGHGVNSPHDERRHDWLETLGQRRRRP